MQQSRSGRKIFAFFESDLGADPIGQMTRALDQGFELLALDPPAIGAATAAGLPCAMFDDFIGPQERLAAAHEAEESLRRWYADRPQHFSWNGVCWPEFDSLALFHFWLEVAMANAYLQAFETQDVQVLRTFDREPVRGGTYPEEFPRFGSSYVSSRIWGAFSGTLDLQRCLAGSKETLRERARRTLGGVSRPARFSIARRSLASSEALEGKLVIAFRWNESHRMLPLVRELADAFPGKVAAVCHQTDPLVARSIQQEWPVPIHLFESAVPQDRQARDRFEAGLTGLLDGVHTTLGRTIRDAGFQLRYCCAQRWPQLARDFERWIALWDKTRPAAVFVSAVDTAEKKLPAEAASRLDITTFSVPHSATEWPPNIESVDHVLYGIPQQADLYRAQGVEEERLAPCRDVFVEEEYRIAGSIQLHERPNITWLTEPPGYAGLVAPIISLSAQLQALNSLDATPSAVRERANQFIKGHPSGLEHRGLFRALNEGARNAVTRPDAPLKPLLEQADLVVAANYCGSALVHALQLEKPVILYWTDRLLGELPTFEERHARSFSTAGAIVRDPTAFWDLVTRFFDDPAVAAELVGRSRAFREKKLTNVDFPSLPDVVENAGLPLEARA